MTEQTPKDSFVRRATVLRVHDGDTVFVDVDLGFYDHTQQSCRLSGLNARELKEPGGPEARDHLMEMLPVGAEIVVQSFKPDNYGGRFDARVWIGDVDVNAKMIADGYAVPWDGRGPRPVPPWPIP